MSVINKNYKVIPIEIKKHISLIDKLTEAIWLGDSDYVKEVISSGVNVNAKCQFGQTPFIQAINTERIQIARLLINAGADIHQTDNFGKTALHNATDRNIPEVIEFLIKMGLDVNKTDNWGNSSFNLATWYINSPYIINLFVNAGADLNSSNNDGCTPLYHAVSYNTSAMVQLLLSLDVNLHTVNNEECTVLHAAAKRGNMAIMLMLVKAGLDIYAQDYLFKTPLDYIKKANHKNCFEQVSKLKTLYNKVRSKQIKEEDNIKSIQTDYNFDL